MHVIDNGKYRITLTADSRFRLEDPSHTGYDFVLNPDEWQADENYTVCRISVSSSDKETVIGLVGPIETDFTDCAVLETDTLHVLMGTGISSIDLNRITSPVFLRLDPSGYTHGIYSCRDGYLLCCTYEIQMLDRGFREVWHHETDAPITVCTIEENRIVLIDEDDNRHHIGFDGKRVA